MRARGILFWLAQVSAWGVLCARAHPPGPQAATQQNVAPAPALASETATLPASETVVPRLVQFSGTITDASGKPATGAVAITFSLYTLQEGGAPLWSETQTLTLDSQGRYAVFLGAASADGLPLDLFARGAARWLGVAAALPGIGEEARVLLVGVPYALKAADADTLGGRPASAFLTNDSFAGGAAGVASESGQAGAKPGVAAQSMGGAKASAKTNSKTPASNITGSGTANYVPLWTGSTTQGNSVLFQSGSGTTAKVAIGTTSPTNTFQVNGSTPIYSTGTGAGLAFQDRAGGSSPYGEWYSKENVARFWRSDHGDVLGITDSGYVGIGTTSPSVNLQVSGTNSTGNVQIRASNLATSGKSISYVGADANAGKIIAVVGADGLGTGPLKTPSGFFGTYTSQPAGIVTGNVERMRVTTTGAVGIGTTTPAATLEVNGTGKFDQVVTFAASQTFPNTASLGSNIFTGSQAVTGSVSATQSGTGSAISAANTAASGETVGVQGMVSAATGSGVLGVNVKASATGGQHPGYTGVWGDTGETGNDGVLGTADDGFAMVAYNNSPSGDATLYVENFNTGSGLPLIKAVAGNGTSCIVVNSDGSSFCQGTHSTVVPVDGRQLALYTIEAPENWFEDFGSASLSGGIARVKLDPAFAATVNTGMEYHVFLTPKGDCEGLFVTSETPAGFEVRELRHGQSNVAFDYRIVARRKGYEGVRLADETQQMNTPPPDSRGSSVAAARVAADPAAVRPE